jgi:LysM repeat protein
MKTKITESELAQRSAGLREKIAQLESQQTDEGIWDSIKSGWNSLTGGGQPAAATPPAPAATPGTPAAGVAFNQGKPGEAPPAQAQAAAGPAGAPPKPAANAREQQYNTALKQIQDLYAKAKVQYPPQDDIIRQRFGLPPALPPIAQWDGKMPAAGQADWLTRNVLGRDASKAVAGQQAANNISNTANAKSDAETEADVKELGTLVAQLKDALAGKGPAPVSLSQAATPGTPAAGVAFNQGKAPASGSPMRGGFPSAPPTLAESIARLNKKIRLMEYATPNQTVDPQQAAAQSAPPPLDTTGKDNGIQKIKDLMAKINGNNEDPPQDVAQALSDAQAAIDQFEAAAKNAPPAVSLDNGVNAQGQNVTITNADGSTTNPETGETTPAPNNASSSYTGAPGKAINPETGEEYTPLAPAAVKPTGPITSKQIYDLNKDVIGANPNLIKPGQQLKMPDGSTYTVKAGDNLSKIAKQAPVDTAPVPVSANTSSSYTGARSAAPATAESVSYRDDQALARIVELSRR